MGVDGTRNGWVAVVVVDDRVADVWRVADLATVVDRVGAVPFGVDIPIGLRALGVELPDHVEGGDRLPPDDVFDAAIVAWTAGGCTTRRGCAAIPTRRRSGTGVARSRSGRDRELQDAAARAGSCRSCGSCRHPASTRSRGSGRPSR